MTKPWITELRGKTLEAFVGAYGISTGQFQTSGELVWFACRLFDIDPTEVKGVNEAADKIEALGKKERSVRAHRNRPILFPSEPISQSVGQADTITQEGLQRMFDASAPKLIDGEPFDCEGQLDIDPVKLLKKVISAVISHDQGHILYDFPEVLAFLGSRIPDRSEVAHHHSVDERMFEAKAKWPNLKKD